MTDLNNNFNIGTRHQTYAPNLKKGEDKTPPTVDEKVEVVKGQPTSLDQDPKAVGGKSQIRTSAVSFKADMDAYMKNPEMARRAINAGDFAYDMMEAQDVAHAYEKACCGSLDASSYKCRK